MKTIKLIPYSILFLSFIGFTSCEDEKEELEEAIVRSLPNTMTAKINDNDVDYGSVSVTKNGNSIEIIGKAENQNYPQLSVTLLDTLNIQQAYAMTPLVMNGLDSKYSASMTDITPVQAGTLVITNFDTDKEVFTGTFSGIYKKTPTATDSLLITEGAFYGKY